MKPINMMVWLLVFLLISVSIYFLFFAWADVFHLDNSIAIYWLDLNNIALRLLLACVLLPCMLLVCILMIMRHKHVSRWLLIALISTNIIAVFALPAGILRDYQQQTSGEFNNDMYYVLWSYGTVSIGNPRPMIDLYQCKKLGFLCQKIYRHIGSSLRLPGEAHLLTDSATNSLTLEINGEVVYTHHP